MAHEKSKRGIKLGLLSEDMGMNVHVVTLNRRVDALTAELAELKRHLKRSWLDRLILRVIK